MPVQQNNIQQQAIAANMAAADRVSDANKEEVIREARDTKISNTESVVKQALNGATGSKGGTQLLAALMSKLGDSFSTDKILNKMTREETVPEGKEDYNDTVTIKLANSRLGKASNKGSEERGGEQSDSQRQPEVRDYLKSYSQFLVNGGSELKKKVEKQESSLVESGKIKAGELMKFRADIAKSVRQEVMKQVKESFQKELFAQGKIEEMIAHNGVLKAADWAYLNEKIGGKEFGGLNTSLKGSVDEAAGQAKEEINTFMQDELSRAVAKKMIADGDEAGESGKRDQRTPQGRQQVRF